MLVTFNTLKNIKNINPTGVRTLDVTVKVL